MNKEKNSKIKMEHIDRLSRGKKSGINIGSRRFGHHLNNFERDIYECALKKKYLDIDERSRDNLFNLWEKVAVAKGWRNIVLVKDKDRLYGKVFIDKKLVFSDSLDESKKYIKGVLQ